MPVLNYHLDRLEFSTTNLLQLEYESEGRELMSAESKPATEHAQKACVDWNVFWTSKYYNYVCEDSYEGKASIVGKYLPVKTNMNLIA